MTSKISDMKILVVEDSKPVRLVLKTYINQIGIEPDFAETGSEAHQKLISENYDLIFMDINLPGMNGIEIMKKMRGEGMKTPSFAMTADDSATLLSNCLEAGFNSFLLKPLRKDELLNIINKRHKTLN